MKFEDAIIDLNNFKKIWHEKWEKECFILKDRWNDDVYHLLLVDYLCKEKNVSIEGQDVRTYSVVSTFNGKYLKEEKDNPAYLAIMEYFAKESHVLNRFCFKTEKIILDENLWESF